MGELGVRLNSLQITTYNVFTQHVPSASDAAWMQDGADDEDGGEHGGHEQDGMHRARSAQDIGHASTVLILEYADRGTLDKAIVTGRFLNKATGSINLVSQFPGQSHDVLELSNLIREFDS